MNNISPVINKLLAYNQSFAARGDWLMVHSWIAEGCSLVHDIMPAIEEMTGRNKGITTIAYFTPCVMRKRDNRLELEKAIKGQGTVSAEHLDMARIVRLKSMGIPLSKAQKELLTQHRP